MNNNLLFFKLILVTTLISLLCGCGLLSKRQISQAEAEKIIYKSLESFFPQFLPDKSDVNIETAAGGDDDLVSATMTGHLSEPTFLVDKTITLPSGRQINLVRPYKTTKDIIQIPVTAIFSPTSDDWILTNTPSFGVNPNTFGNSLSQLNGAIDETTEFGKTLLIKAQAYENALKEQDELSKKLSDLTDFETQLSSNVTWNGAHPSFTTIYYYFGDLASTQGYENGNVWLKLRLYYSEEWTQNNLGHVFDGFSNDCTPPLKDLHVLTRDQWQQIVPPIVDRTVVRDLSNTKAKLAEIQKHISALQDDLRNY